MILGCLKVEGFTLYSSTLAAEGATHRAEMEVAF